MKPAWTMKRVRLYHGDCVAVMATLPENSIDAVICDPPYGLEFMGKDWDKLGAYTGVAKEGTDKSHPFRDGSTRVVFGASAKSMQTWHEAWAREALRVLKPGGHLLAFSGTRTYHRMACAIEDAGFEVRDCLMYLFGSGFPKSLDVSKALDKAAGAEREIVGSRPQTGAKFGLTNELIANGGFNDPSRVGFDLTAPATDLAREWEGWGTALKPAYEPIVLARKPLIGTVAQNVTAHGTGGLNIDGCRIEAPDGLRSGGKPTAGPVFMTGPWPERAEPHPSGRWPANVLLDEEAAAALDEMSGESSSTQSELTSTPGAIYGSGRGLPSHTGVYGFNDRGGASRFFFTAKSPRSEREFGLDDLDVKQPHEITGRKEGSAGQDNPRASVQTGARRNTHPTVKPLDLMQWLCRLATPPNGIILDPFMGSGTTGMAAIAEGFRFIGIDQDAHYVEIAKRRIERQASLETTPHLKQRSDTMRRDVEAAEARRQYEARGYKPIV